MKLFRNIYSDWIKTKNTPIRLIIYIVPIVYTSLVIWYASISAARQGANYEEYIYFAFFELMSICFPLAEGLLCGLFGRLEQNAGGFYNNLSKDSRTVSYLGTFFMITLMTVFVVMGSTFILILGMKFILHVKSINYIFFLYGALLEVFGCLFLIAIHLTLSFKFGIGASMAAGGAGFLIAAMIGANPIGEKIWQYVPWTWPVKLPQIVQLFMTDITSKNGINLLDYVKGEFIYNLPIVIACTVIIVFLNIIWFKAWEGKRSHE